MYKIKEKKLNTLVHYHNFLKNNDLKKNKFKLKNILFENEILLKKKGMNMIELKKRNFLIPETFLNLNKIIYTIQTQYQEHFLFNYHFNYNLIHYFSKLMFKNKTKKNKDVIKGRVIGRNKKGILILIFGIIFKIKPKELHKNRRIYYKSKKLKSTKIISFYKLKYLNFKIDKDILSNKSTLSRKLYVKEINEKNKI